MMFYTHVLTAVLIFNLFGFSPTNIMVGSFMAVLPDIDKTNSIVGKVFAPVSKFISKRYSHRSITHSFLALGIIGLTSLIFRNTQLSLCIAGGYFLHLFFDMLNPSGVPLLYPSCHDP